MILRNLLSKYEILEELGRGGFGVVYKARDTVLDRIVAVKVLHPNLVNDSGFVSRFRNEARLAAQLNHSNVVPVYDLGESEGLYYIVMGYMPGGSLKEMLQKDGALPGERALTILRQVSNGLNYAHKKGIIHRDLKPGNILFDEEGEACISDLGFAKALHTDSSASLSMSGGLVGTPAYMAPEIWNGLPATPAVDVYSSACIFVEMLTGKQLFEGDSIPVIMRKHFEPYSFPNSIPDNVQIVLQKALAQDHLARYSSINQFINALMEMNDSKSKGDTPLPFKEVSKIGPEDTQQQPQSIEKRKVHNKIIEGEKRTNAESNIWSSYFPESAKETGIEEENDDPKNDFLNILIFPSR